MHLLNHRQGMGNETCSTRMVWQDCTVGAWVRMCLLSGERRREEGGGETRGGGRGEERKGGQTNLHLHVPSHLF